MTFPNCFFISLGLSFSTLLCSTVSPFMMSKYLKKNVIIKKNIFLIKKLNFRLAKAFADLKNTLETEQDLKEHEDYLAAEQVLKEAEPQLPEIITS